MHPNTAVADKPSAPRRRRRLRKVLRRIAVTLVVIGLIVFAVIHFSTRNDGNTPDANPNPFIGTPAATWAVGADGIVVPAATAVTGFTQAEVAADLPIVKQALVAARLDRIMLDTGDPTTFLNLVAPAERDNLKGELNGKLGWATVIDDSVTLSHSYDPRVSGTMTFSSIVDKKGLRALQVETNYVWAYAFEDTKVAIIHDQDHWLFYRSGDVPANDAGLWLDDYQSYAYNIDCAAVARGRLAPPPDPMSLDGIADQPQDGSGDAPDNSMFDPNHAMNINGNC